MKRSDIVELKKTAIAGSLESNDVLVTMIPGTEGREIEIDSIVEKQFLDNIEETIEKVLDDYKIDNIKLKVQDRGALDCVLEARLETAILRGEE